MLTLWNINDDEDNIVVLVIPREPALLGCHVPDSYLCSIYILLIDIFFSEIYFAQKYILLRNISCSEIYLAHKYIFDASLLGKKMVDILLLTFLELS